MFDTAYTEAVKLQDQLFKAAVKGDSKAILRILEKCNESDRALFGPPSTEESSKNYRLVRRMLKGGEAK